MKNIVGIKNKKLFNTVMNIVYPLLAFGVIVAIWSIIAASMNKPIIFPMPSKIFSSLIAAIKSDAFWTSVGWSLLRTIICFLISFVLALIFAFLGNFVNPFHRVMSPIISILRAVPTMAIILIAMLWLNGSKASILIGFLIAFPLLYQSFYTSIEGVDKDLVEMSKFYKVSPINRVLYLYLPETSDSMFDVSASTISLTLKVVIAAEVMSYAKNSIGLQMKMANQEIDIAMLFSWTIIAIALSFILEGIVKLLKLVWRKIK